MHTFVIEREIPQAGRFTDEDLREISHKSCCVLDGLGTSIQWVHSYVTDDKIYCVYRAATADLIRRHAVEGGFPANSIAAVRAVIDPTTAEPPALRAVAGA
jgi:hypothetical protein